MGSYCLRFCLELGSAQPILCCIELTEAQEQRLRHAFLVDSFRSFDQDPRYGLIVLAEIAMKALSPGVNDPDTAIQVLSMQYRVLEGWARPHPQPPEVLYPHVGAPGLAAIDLFEDAFAGIAQYGADNFAVAMRLKNLVCPLPS